MTPEGIKAKDWDQVIYLAGRIASAILHPHTPDEDSVKFFKIRMLECLAKLENRYGRLPSILATRAGYVGDRESIKLWKEAYDLAEARGDTFNLVLIASSLAEYYVENARDERNGTKWLQKLAQALTYWDDPYERKTLRRLQVAVKKLRGNVDKK